MSDFDESFKMWSDPEVTHFIGGPHSKEDVWARLLRYIGHWYAFGFGTWTVESSDGTAYVGEVGFSDYRRDITPRLDAVPEIAWVLKHQAQGVGFAYEATRAALAWGDTTLASKKTFCLIPPEHTRSHHVAAKLGYLIETRSAYREYVRDVLIRDSRNMINSELLQSA